VADWDASRARGRDRAAIIEYIAKTEGKTKASVTTEDIFDRVRYFGMGWDDTLRAQKYVAAMEAEEIHAGGRR
jgi:hypothetical protein